MLLGITTSHNSFRASDRGKVFTDGQYEYSLEVIEPLKGSNWYIYTLRVLGQPTKVETRNFTPERRCYPKTKSYDVEYRHNILDVVECTPDKTYQYTLVTRDNLRQVVEHTCKAEHIHVNLGPQADRISVEFQECVKIESLYRSTGGKNIRNFSSAKFNVELDPLYLFALPRCVYIIPCDSGEYLRPEVKWDYSDSVNTVINDTATHEDLLHYISGNYNFSARFYAGGIIIVVKRCRDNRLVQCRIQVDISDYERADFRAFALITIGKDSYIWIRKVQDTNIWIEKEYSYKKEHKMFVMRIPNSVFKPM